MRNILHSIKPHYIFISKYRTSKVTDIKVGFNSLLGFRISIWLGGWAIITQRNVYARICSRPHSALLQTLHNTSVSSSPGSAKYLSQLFCKTKIKFENFKTTFYITVTYDHTMMNTPVLV